MMRDSPYVDLLGSRQHTGTMCFRHDSIWLYVISEGAALCVTAHIRSTEDTGTLRRVRTD
jgi:hypothetical protein